MSMMTAAAPKQTIIFRTFIDHLHFIFCLCLQINMVLPIFSIT